MNNGLSSMEAHIHVGKFIDKLKQIREAMNFKKKSQLQIENKLQDEFQREFAKLC